MRVAKLLVMICVLVLAANAFAQDCHTLGIPCTLGVRMYVKGECSGGPINSPLCEDRNLTDPTIDGEPNPDYCGVHKEFLFYDGTLHILPTGKVGFLNKIWASGNGSCDGVKQKGTVNVEGVLFGPELRPWKSGCPMTINVWGDDALLDITNILRIGVNDGGPTPGVLNLMGGTVKANNLDFYADDSYIDITGGELLIKNSNWDVAAVEAAIAAGDIFNSNANEGYVIAVTEKDVDGTLYTSLTLEFDPLLRSIYLLGQAIDTKDSANEVLDEAIAMEMTAKGLLEEVLAGLDPEDPNYEDVDTAKSMTQVAIVGERACVRKIDKTAGKLENALGLLGVDAGGQPPKPPKP